MEAKTKRVIKSRDNFRHLMPDAQYERIVRADMETVNGTIDLMRDVVFRTYKKQMYAFSKLFVRDSVVGSCWDIWQWVVDHIEYKADDKNNEEVRTPARLFADGAGDCDCMSVFVSSILMNLGIPHEFKVTGYEKKKKHWWGGESKFCDDFQHVYVVAYDESEKPIIIDCVVDKFNYEEPYCKSKSMALIELAGPPRINFGNNHIGEDPLTSALSGDVKGNLINYFAKKPKAELQALKEKNKGVSAVSQAVGDNLAPAMLNITEFDLGSAFKNGDYVSIMKKAYEIATPIAKQVINSIVPGAGAILDVTDGIAKLFGFNNTLELFNAPWLGIADLMSDIPEMQEYLVPTVAAHYTHCEVAAFDTNVTAENYQQITGAIICCCRSGSQEWKQGADKMMRELFKKAQANLEFVNYYGIPASERKAFQTWAWDNVKRVNIFSKDDFKAIGINTNRSEWDEDNTEDLEDLQGLHTWLFSWEGYTHWDDEQNENAKADMTKWFGPPWKSVSPMTTLEMANDWQLRYPDSTVDIFTGAKIYKKTLNKEEFLPVEPSEIITPNAIYKSNKYFVANPSGISGLGAINTYVPLKQMYATELGLKSTGDLAAAMAILSEAYEGFKANWQTVAWLIGAPIIGVGLGTLAYKLKKRKTNK